MTKAKVYRKPRYSPEDLRDALNYLKSGSSRNVHAVAKKFNVPRSTLRDRFLGLHESAHASHEKHQLLSNEAEEALCQWMEHLSEQGRPISKRTILRYVEHASGTRPSKRWYRRFLARHPDIKLGKPSGLDPKRAQSFNRAAVDEHFRTLRHVLDTLQIPWENVYNMDEKGCQRGGGRKQSFIKYFVPRNRRPKYRRRSANLELVTVIECVCADGSSLTPGFVFAGKEYLPEWFQVQDDIWYVSFLTKALH